MANAEIRAESVRRNTAAEALKSFRVNDSTPLGCTGTDAVHQILPMIHSLSTALEMAHRKVEGLEPEIAVMNPEILASAFEAIAYLSAICAFHADLALHYGILEAMK